MKLKLIQRFTRFKSEIKAVRTISLLISVPGNKYEEYAHTHAAVSENCAYGGWSFLSEIFA
jgi:hypothetical protein